MKPRRRFTTAVLVVAGVLAVSAAGTEKGKATDQQGTSVHVKALSVTVPRDLVRYAIRGGGHMAGTRAPVIGVLATDDQRAHRSGEGFAKWSQVTSNTFLYELVRRILAKAVSRVMEVSLSQRSENLKPSVVSTRM